MLTREQILEIQDAKIEEVKIPEWGGSVFIKSMSSRERDRFEELHLSQNKANTRARIAAACTCDADGALLFTEADIEALGQKDGKAVNRIFSKAMDLCGFTADDVEELEKN